MYITAVRIRVAVADEAICPGMARTATAVVRIGLVTYSDSSIPVSRLPSTTQGSA